MDDRKLPPPFEEEQQPLIERARRYWRIGVKIPFDLAAALHQMGFDLEALEKRYAR